MGSMLGKIKPHLDIMIVVISRGNTLDKYRDQFKKHRRIIILGFKIYILYDI